MNDSDVLSDVEKFFKERNKLNKRRKNKKDSIYINVYVGIHKIEGYVRNIDDKFLFLDAVGYRISHGRTESFDKGLMKIKRSDIQIVSFWDRYTP